MKLALLGKRVGRGIVSADWFSAAVALVATFAIIGVLHPEFVSFSQVRDVFQQSTYGAIMAAALVFLVTQGEVDLSISGLYVLSSVSAAMLINLGFNTWVAALIVILMAVVVGLFNSAIVQIVGIPSLIATLAMGWVLRGLGAAMSEGKQIIGMPVQDSFFQILGGQSYLGIPVSVWILILIIIVLTVVLRKTPFGYRVREIGSNQEAAKFAGLPMARTKTIAFVLSSVLSAVAGLLGLAFFTSGDPTAGAGLELYAVAGAVIGGNPLSGGSATVFGAVIGAVLLNAVGIGLVYFNIPAVWSQFAAGAVIIAAVSLDGVLRMRKAKRLQ